MSNISNVSPIVACETSVQGLDSPPLKEKKTDRKVASKRSIIGPHLAKQAADARERGDLKTVQNDSSHQQNKDAEIRQQRTIFRTYSN